MARVEIENSRGKSARTQHLIIRALACCPVTANAHSGKLSFGKTCRTKLKGKMKHTEIEMRTLVLNYRLCRRETFKCAVLADISRKSRKEATTRFRWRNIICLRTLYDDIARSDAVRKS